MPQTPNCEDFPVTSEPTSEALWLTTEDGTKHFVRFWSAGNPGPVAVYLHGIEGHSTWFEETARELNKESISVYAIDRRGAGASTESRGDIASYKRLLTDLEELLFSLKARHKNAPVFLIANCWGAKLGIPVAAKNPNSALQGLVLISPAIATQVDAPPLTKFKIGLNYLLGGRGLYEIPLTPQHFTENPRYLKFIADDPLRLTQASARFFIESLKLSTVCRKESAHLRLPVLVLQSGRDAIVKVETLKHWFQSIPSTDKRLEIFTSAAHSLDFECDTAEYLTSLKGWLLAKAELQS